MPAPKGTAKKTTLPQQAPAQLVQAPAEPQKPQKPEWQCEISKPTEKEGSFTVGEVFAINCQGPELSLTEPLQVKFPEGKEYSLVLLKKLELTSTKLSFEATSYRATQHSFPYLDFVDAKGGGFVSQPLNLQVMSLLPQPPPKTIAAGYGPVTMGWPVWLFFTIFLIVAVLMGWTFVFFRKRIQRKNLEKNIRKFLSPLGSYHQFSKDVRKLRSSVLFSERHEWPTPQVQSYIVDLDQHFRMFLLREFTVPATSWTSRQTQKAIKSKAKHSYHIFSDSLRKALQELDRALSSFEQMKAHDCDQLTRMVVKTVEAIWACRNKGKTP
ncbi:MAG: hypothetical protein IT287_01230 [Bdellovibrionaceae bacterium]|nr:hypothetical protein [Pseudobdellovibrionaceae bacterium]